MIPMCSCKHSKDAPNSASRSNWPDIKVPLVMVKKVYSIDSRTASVRLTKNVLRAIKKMCCNVSPIGWCTYLPTYIHTYLGTNRSMQVISDFSPMWSISSQKPFNQNKQQTVFMQDVLEMKKNLFQFLPQEACVRCDFFVVTHSSFRNYALQRPILSML